MRQPAAPPASRAVNPLRHNDVYVSPRPEERRSVTDRMPSHDHPDLDVAARLREYPLMDALLWGRAAS